MGKKTKIRNGTWAGRPSADLGNSQDRWKHEALRKATKLEQIAIQWIWLQKMRFKNLRVAPSIAPFASAPSCRLDQVGSKKNLKLHQFLKEKHVGCQFLLSLVSPQSGMSHGNPPNASTTRRRKAHSLVERFCLRSNKTVQDKGTGGLLLVVVVFHSPLGQIMKSSTQQHQTLGIKNQGCDTRHWLQSSPYSITAFSWGN